MESLLQVQDVHKTFASVRAVDGVSLRVDEGELVALLGPNGAGKTTLIRMLIGLILPDAGEVSYRVDGRPAPKLPPSGLGYLPEDRGLYQDVPVLRTIAYFGRLRGMRRVDAERAGMEWLERFELADRAAEPLKSLSKGNQQKVQFAAAVVHRPRFAILDEPFSGLDPLNQDLFVRLIGELRASGTTVLFSAHQMQLVERLAARLVLLHRGREVLSGTLDEVRRRWSDGNRLSLRVADGADADFLDAHPAVERVEHDGGQLTVFTHDGHSLSDLLVTVGSRLDVRSVHAEPVTLHEIYVRTVGADGAGADGAGADGAGADADVRDATRIREAR